MRRLIAGLALLALLVGCGKGDSGGEPSGKPKLAFVTNLVADFWTVASKGVDHAAAEYGVDVDFRMPKDLTDQKNIIEDMLIRGVSGIAISPGDPANQTAFLNDVASRTILITHDSDAPASKRQCFVGVDNYKAGRMCGELVREALPDGGSMVVFVGRLEQDNARRRRQGMIDELLGRDHNPDRYDEPGSVLSGNGYEILATLTDQGDHAKSKANAEDALARYPDLDCMVGLFAYNTPMCLEALRRADRLGKVKVVAFDEDEATLRGIREGHVHGTVVQDPYRYGTESVRILAGLVKGDRSVIPAGGFLEVPARKVKKADVDAFWADLKEKTGK